MRWTVLRTPPAEGAWNMAFDEALLRRAAAHGGAWLRVYSWSSPTLSLGRNQRAAGIYDPATAHALGVDIVRRPTGGRAVLHDREITYAVAAPAGDDEPLRDAYARLNRLLLDALRALGVAAELARPAGRAPRPTAAPCFDTHTSGEVVVGGRKLAGSAQWRDGGALLQHGSILVDDDQGLVARLAGRPADEPAAAPATLREVLGRPVAGREMLDALLAAVRRHEDASAALDEPDADLVAEADRLRARYEDPAWTWRR